jgi:glycosyltransferase involved in cell wall biosynthesis
MPNTDVFITNNLQVEHFEKGCDVFMYNRILPNHAIAQIKELQLKYGFKVCVDIDDYWQLDEHHILYDYYKEIDFQSQQIKHIQEADVVLTTNERLAEEIELFNSNVHVCPNAIPKKGQFDLEREPYYLTRLFWQGSITHRQDIELLRKPLESLGPIAAKIKMVMGGYTEGEPEWYEMAMTYTAQAKHQYKLLPGVEVNQYYTHYTHADICLIPLVNSRFNRMKSNLKVLEAANLGLPVIASNVHPYLDMPIFYCKCSADWVKHIVRLVGSRKRQKEAGLELKEFCDEHFNFDKINRERKQILEYTAKTVGV